MERPHSTGTGVVGSLGCPQGGPGLNVYMFVFCYFIYIYKKIMHSKKKKHFC